MANFAPAPVAPAPTPSAPRMSSSNSASGSAEFAPHLDDAISRQQKSSAAESQKPVEANPQEISRDDSDSETVVMEDSDYSNQTQDMDDGSGETVMAHTDQNGSTGQTDPYSQAGAGQTDTASTDIIWPLPIAMQGDTIVRGNVQQEMPAPPAWYAVQFVMADASADAAKQLEGLTDQQLSALLNGNAMPNSETGQSRQTAMIEQLQQIIAAGKENGQVVIQSSSGDTVASTAEITAGLTGIRLTSGEFSELRPEPSNHQMHATRLNSAQQFLEARLSFSENTQGNMGNFEGGQQESNGQSPALFTNLPTPGAFTEGSQFSQAMALTQQQTSSFPMAEAGKTVTLASGTMVHEAEVLHQIVERFHFMRRPSETTINIKLHPAELGELKIDLTLKEGGIRANVIAQSQHVQEILEKNMPKLRNLLENQGLTIDDFVVSTETDEDTDFELFDDHLSRENEFLAQQSSPTPQQSSGVNFDAIVEQYQPDNGLNVTA